LGALEGEVRFEFSSESDGEENNDPFVVSGPKIIPHRMKEPISKFPFDELREEALNAFTGP
jgi:hypothetical protein